jgi:phosphatidylethanolamine-binding protein (PEBP) family uncharacterized protein
MELTSTAFAPQRTWVHWVLYALDVRLTELPTPSKAAVERAMRGHVLAQAELVGIHRKARA